MEHRDDIQIMRGICVLLVVFYHLQLSAFANGFLGVDAFFVISGYIMQRLYAESDWRIFFRRRIERLAPAALVAILVTTSVAAWIVLPWDFDQVATQAILSAAFVSNIGLWNTDSYFAAEEFRPLLNTWSLGVEMQTYLALPILWMMFRRSPALLVGCIILSLVACVAMVHFSPKTAFFISPFRAWQFLLGVAAARFGDRIGRASLGIDLWRLIALGLAAAALWLVPVDPEARDIVRGHPMLASILMSMAASIALIVRFPKAISGTYLGRALSVTGNLSYSIYLYHFPVIVLVNYDPFGGTRLGFESPGALATMVAATITLSCLSYKLVEQGEVWRRNRLALSGLLATVILIAAWTPLEVFNRTGFSERQLLAFDARDDGYENRCGKLFRLSHPTERVCTITQADAGGTILLIGNSHADAIKSAFAETAGGRATLLFYTDVSVLFGRIGVREIVEDVRRMEVTDVVLHYSNVYPSPSRRAALQDLVEELNGTGVRVSLIAPVPTYDGHVPEMLYEASIGSSRLELRTLSDHQEAIRDFQSFERSLSDSSVRFFDPAPLLCSDGPCRLENGDGAPFYFDRMHLTRTGALELAPIFDEIVAGAATLLATAPSN